MLLASYGDLSELTCASINVLFSRLSWTVYLSHTVVDEPADPAIVIRVLFRKLSMGGNWRNLDFMGGRGGGGVGEGMMVTDAIWGYA